MTKSSRLQDRAPLSKSWVRALCALALLPSVIAVVQLGRIHPDEVFQALEPAFRWVHGYGVVAWEWEPQNALRNWAFPGVLALLLRLAEGLGISHPQAYRAVLALPQLLLHGLALFAVYRYCQRRLPSTSAALATFLFGVQGIVLVFAGRTLSESVSTAFLVLAAEALDREKDTPSRIGLTLGLSLGLAVVVRYPSAVMVLAALASLVLRRRWAVLRWTVLAGSGVALVLGGLDFLTWDRPFRSLYQYLYFNVFTRGAAIAFGTSPASIYFLPLLLWAPLWTWPGLKQCLFRERPQLPAPLLLGGAYLMAILATPHKEVRFLYPVVVLLSMAAAPEFLKAAMGWLGRHPGWMRWGVLPPTLAALAVSLIPLAFSPEVRGDQFRAIVQATRKDATGLLIVNEGRWGTGGSFYIGKPIPFLTCDTPEDVSFQAAMSNSNVNRAVTFEGRALEALQAHGFRITGVVGRETILER